VRLLRDRFPGILFPLPKLVEGAPSELRHNLFEGERTSTSIYDEAIPFVARLSNHERDCDTVFNGEERQPKGRRFEQIGKQGSKAFASAA
jgi:hypothetical protein